MQHSLLVMVVDDSAAMRRVLSAILSAGGHEIVVAEDVTGALEILAVQRPDVLLTDYTMPGLTGLDLVRRVRADADFDAMPILVVSSEQDPRLRMGMEAAGANGWLPKPVCAETLLGLLDAMSDTLRGARRQPWFAARQSRSALAG